VTVYYAATLTSVYEFHDERDLEKKPVVRKAALRMDADSTFQVGHSLTGGLFIGVTKHGVMLYDEDIPMYGSSPGTKRPMPPEMCNTRYWGDCTSTLRGLFTEMMDAVACLDGSMLPEMVVKHSQAVIKAIGPDHPLIVFASGTLGYDPEEDKRA
jgi:hypothetical protein